MVLDRFGRFGGRPHVNDDLALLWERVLSGNQADGDVELWRRLQASRDPAAKELLATVRMHRLLTVALGGQSAQTIARHAIDLAAVAGAEQRHRAVGATMHRLRRHRWRGYVAMATAAVLIVGLSVWLIEGAASPPAAPALIVTAAPAAGKIWNLQGQPLTGSVLPVGGTLSGSGEWELRSPDQRATLSVSGATRLAMIDATTVRLDHGELSVSVTSGGPAIWRFITPHAEARIIGTRFTLTVTDAATGLAVAEGIVSFQPTGGEAFPVAAGGSALTESPAQRLWLAANFSEAVPDWSVATDRILPGPDQRMGFCGVVPQQSTEPSYVGVAFAGPGGRPLAEVPPGSSIAADVWLDPGTSKPLTVQLWDLDAGQNFQTFLPDLPRGCWLSIHVPIADLKPVFPERAPGPLRRPRALMFALPGNKAGQLWVTRARLLAPPMAP